MKTIARIIAFTVCAVLILSLFACSGGTKGTETEAATEAVKASETTIETNAAPSAAEETTSASEAQSSSRLIGSWTYTEEDFPCTYTFNADGTGTYDIFGETMYFTYTDNGDGFSFSIDGADSYNDYRIEGDKLIITDDLGQDIVYVKN